MLSLTVTVYMNLHSLNDYEGVITLESVNKINCTHAGKHSKCSIQQKVTEYKHDSCVLEKIPEFCTKNGRGGGAAVSTSYSLVCLSI